jgi:hypothetical protein
MCGATAVSRRHGRASEEVPLAAFPGGLGAAIQISNMRDHAHGIGSWGDAFRYLPDFGDGPYEAFVVNQQGWITLGNGPAGSPANQFKTIRIGAGGSLEFLNSAQSVIIAQLSDLGKFTAAQSIKFTPLAVAPAAEHGLMYQRAADGKLLICEDGGTWKTITTT